MKNIVTVFIVAATVALPVHAAEKPLATDQEKTLYALGALVARSIQTFDLTPAELAQMQRGLTDGVLQLSTPSQIAADRIKSQYLDAVLHAAEVAEIFVERVVITLRKDQR